MTIGKVMKTREIAESINEKWRIFKLIYSENVFWARDGIPHLDFRLLLLTICNNSKVLRAK